MRSTPFDGYTRTSIARSSSARLGRVWYSLSTEGETVSQVTAHRPTRRIGWIEGWIEVDMSIGEERNFCATLHYTH